MATTNQTTYLKRHALLIGVVVLAPIVFAIFTWAEYGYFCDQGREHGNHACQSFWSSDHLHDWIYNATSNWQSDLIIGILLVLILSKLEGPRGADREDT